ncbi:MAG: methionyl-tRNA formyltransferase [Clostridiales bacterium]|nr:methionyl-tRNA formyltransferase [Clostridiales bacterium]
MKILFMGTPEFAAAALDILCDEFGDGVIGAVTKTDTPKNRGQKLLPPPVKVLAQSRGIPVYQPEKLKDGAFEQTLKELAPDLIVVAAYGKILPKYVLDTPKYGCINIHGSILPKYRGAAPIQRAIMNGEKTIGITIMQMNEGLDTGDVYESAGLDFENESCGEIFDSLAKLGGKLAVKVIHEIENGTAKATKQDDSLSTYAEKISKEECALDFSESATDINNKIRALTPSPCAVCRLKDKLIKITAAQALPENSLADAGVITAVSAKGAGYIDIAAGAGTLRVLRLVPEGKKEMSAGDFARGRGCAVGDKFEKAMIL